MKMKQAIIRKLVIWLIVAVLFSCGIMGSLLFHMQAITDRAADQLGSLYMSEMMSQMRDHFETIIDIKTEEVYHIAAHAGNLEGDALRSSLKDAATRLGFDYLALYDSKGDSENILGEVAWYRGIDDYISDVISGSVTVTTGYLTEDGDKYIVFGVPVSYEMMTGTNSSVMLVGFSVEKLYNYICIDNRETFGSDTRVWIILTNGSFVLCDDKTDETSFYNHIRNIGSFVGTDVETGVADIEGSMANGENFSCTVSIDNEQLHIYGSAANEPEDWYFVLSMPQGAADAVVDSHSKSSMNAFFITCVIVFVMFLIVFFAYMRMSMRQLSETENARAEAENANLAKSTFLFNASHDIRTPMNAIQGFAKIIERNPEDSELVRKNIVKINKSGETLMQLLNDVLELSRIESDKVELEPVPLDLEKQMENMQNMFQQDMQAAGIDFSVESNVTEKVVLCDTLKLTRILMNLLSNSKKFTPKGGSVVCGVEQLSSDKDIGRYRFYVNDTGIGMSEEFQKRAFEQFERERTSTVSGMQGSGLGLSIIKRIVDKMEGTCSLESTLGKGTRFDVILDMPFSEMPVKNESTDNIPKAKLAGCHLLLVEDNELNREITRYIIDSLGMTADEAVDGAEALEIITDRPSDTYDLILMDIQMPVMDGFTASECIRRLDDPVRSRIPIVALTANAFREDRDRCLAAGMNAHVCKPIDSDELCAAIVVALNKQHI